MTSLITLMLLLDTFLQFIPFFINTEILLTKEEYKGGMHFWNTKLPASLMTSGDEDPQTESQSPKHGKAKKTST